MYQITRLPRRQRTRLTDSTALTSFTPPPTAIIQCSNDVATIMSPVVHLEQESVWALGLNGRRRLVALELVALGSVDHVHVCARDVFRALVRRNCAALILVHNHPSTNPRPSDDDNYLTRRIHDAAELLGILLLDHVIIAGTRHYSYAVENALPMKGGR